MTFSKCVVLVEELVCRKIGNTRTVRIDERTIEWQHGRDRATLNDGGDIYWLICGAVPSGYRCYADGSSASAQMAANIAGLFDVHSACTSR